MQYFSVLFGTLCVIG